MTALRKRSLPDRWAQRRERSAARSGAYWQARRAAAADRVDEVAVAWDRLRSAMRSLDRRADNRVARARKPEDSREAARKRELSVRLIDETCGRAIACLDRLADDVRRQS